jgi:hypothetical protein
LKFCISGGKVESCTIPGTDFAFQEGKSGFCTIPARVLKKVKINAEYKRQNAD